MIRKTLKVWHGQWDLAIPFLLGEYRRAPNETMGFTPLELLYGRQIRGPMQALRQRWTGDTSAPKEVGRYLTSIQEKLEKIKEILDEREVRKKQEQKRRFNEKAKMREFKAGQLVLVRMPWLGPKLESEWDGPYLVEKRLDETTYQLALPEQSRKRLKRNVNLLKKFISPTAGCLLIDGEEDDLESTREEEGEGQLVLSQRLT